jgi:hypothetical protein
MKKRWKVTLFYANDVKETYEIDCMSELEDIVDIGPDYRFLNSMTFEYQL